MIQGVVNARYEAVVRLRVRGPGGIKLDVDAIVDSGFTSSLTLPMTAVTALSLARQSGGTALLADGSVRQFDIFAAEVMWDESWRSVLVSAVGNESLMGMRLMAGHKLLIRDQSGRRRGDNSVTLILPCVSLGRAGVTVVRDITFLAAGPASERSRSATETHLADGKDCLTSRPDAWKECAHGGPPERDRHYPQPL